MAARAVSMAKNYITIFGWWLGAVCLFAALVFWAITDTQRIG